MACVGIFYKRGLGRNYGGTRHVFILPPHGYVGMVLAYLFYLILCGSLLSALFLTACVSCACVGKDVGMPLGWWGVVLAHLFYLSLARLKKTQTTMANRSRCFFTHRYSSYFFASLRLAN